LRPTPLTALNINLSSPLVQLYPSGGAARKTDFILPLAAGNGKSLTAPYPCPGAVWAAGI